MQMTNDSLFLEPSNIILEQKGKRKIVTNVVILKFGLILIFQHCSNLSYFLFYSIFQLDLNNKKECLKSYIQAQLFKPRHCYCIQFYCSVRDQKIQNHCNKANIGFSERLQIQHSSQMFTEHLSAVQLQGQVPASQTEPFLNSQNL